MGDRDEELPPFGHKQASPGASSRLVSSDPVVMIGIFLLEDVDESLASNHVNSALAGIIEEVISIARNLNGGDWGTTLGI